MKVLGERYLANGDEFGLMSSVGLVQHLEHIEFGIVTNKAVLINDYSNHAELSPISVNEKHHIAYAAGSDNRVPSEFKASRFVSWKVGNIEV